MPKGAQRGATLIELIAAMAIFVSVVVGVAVAIFSSQRDILSNRLRWTAANLAAQKMDSFKKLPYDLVPATAAGPYLNPDPNGCNCQLADFTTWPQPGRDPDQVVGATTYHVAWCVDYLDTSGPAARSRCTAWPSDSYKGIRVHVSWDVRGQTLAIDQYGTVSR